MGWKKFTQNMKNMAEDLGNLSVTGQGGTVVINGNVVSGGGGVQGKGLVITKTHSGFPEFTKVNSSAMCNLNISVGQAGAGPDFTEKEQGSYREPAPGPRSYLVTVTAQANIHDIIELDVKDGTLYVKTSKSYSTSKGILIEVELPRLAALDASGHGAVNVKGLRGEHFTLDYSGMGNLSIAGSVTKHLAADLSGHGRVELYGSDTEKIVLNHSGMGDLLITGSTQSLVAFLSGHGAVNLGELPTPWLHLMASGMGFLTVNVTGDAKGVISAHGSVRVLGKPPGWNVQHTGMGSVTFQ
jgi:hypothetical protein